MDNWFFPILDMPFEQAITVLTVFIVVVIIVFASTRKRVVERVDKIRSRFRRYRVQRGRSKSYTVYDTSGRYRGERFKWGMLSNMSRKVFSRYNSGISFYKTLRRRLKR